MSKTDCSFEKEAAAIKIERETYYIQSLMPSNKFFDYLSLAFLVLGLIALPLIFFTEITLLNVTCLFVISHVIAPSDGDHYGALAQGIAEDMGNIRASTTVIRKKIEASESTD